jgi:hypothetical protein
MSENKSRGHIMGRLVGFTRRWNPFSTEVFVLVEVDSKVINVPIDYRQQKYIQKEHPIDSRIPLTFYDGRWHVNSRLITADFKMFSDNHTVFF